MERPQIRVIDNQEELSPQDANVSQSEADYLLAKYGYKQTYSPQTQINIPQTPVNNQSFEDMIRSQELQKARTQEDKYRKANQPQSITFNNKDVQYSETKYSDMDIDNATLGIKIQIVTDMKIS